MRYAYITAEHWFSEASDFLSYHQEHDGLTADASIVAVAETGNFRGERRRWVVVRVPWAERQAAFQAMFDAEPGDVIDGEVWTPRDDNGTIYRTMKEAKEVLDDVSMCAFLGIV